MRTTWKLLSNKAKRDDLIGLTRFFVSGEGDEKRKQKIRKVFFSFSIFGLIGLMCGCELETTALSESDISHEYNEEVKKSLRKLISTSNCHKCPLMGVDIGGKDLSRKGGLSQANLTGADLSQANLTKADLTGADLSQANLTGADLTGADLEGVKLDSAILCRTTMPDGKKLYLNCKNANLTGADLSQAYLTGIDLTGATLGGADLTGAYLGGGAVLAGVDLTGADLSQAYLGRAYLIDANLGGANLTGADLTGADLEGVKLDSAILCRTTMPDGKKLYLNCKNANLSQEYLGGADLTGADLTGADLTGADLTGADLNSAIKCKTIFPWGEDNSGCK